ncbi:MAG TPA: choice-of-anchor tandem repeat NxxGxxAF-containing protein [Blastocatellia bacterium]|nr:choice-of-anchor tandem repeat NxxGxxAF-containing protein [Blastocatellia bacterium]
MMMKGSFGRIVGATLMVLSMGLTAAPSGAGSQHPMEVPPDESEIGDLDTNDNGAIVFIAPEGIYRHPGSGKPRLIIRVGDKIGARRGTFKRFHRVVLSNGGRLVFTADIEDGDGESGLFTFREGEGVRPLVLQGFFLAEINGRIAGFGKIGFVSPFAVFHATVEGSERGRSGLFYVHVGTGVVRVLVFEGQNVGGGEGVFASFGDFVVNSFSPLSVVVTFQAGIRDGRHQQGIFAMSLLPVLSEFARIIILDGQDAPGRRTGRFTEFVSLARSPNELVFAAKLDGGDVGWGIFQMLFPGLLPGVDIKALAGGSAPLGGEFSEFGELSINNNELLVFRARLTGGDSPEGLYSVTLGPVLTIILPVARVGQTVPGTRGGRIASIGDFVLNNDTQTIFQARLVGSDQIREGIFLGQAKRLFTIGISR